MWIYDVSKRFARVDRKGRSAATSLFSSIGIGFGVMTLIVVISVMNGFQHYSIDPIMEISSSHLRISDISENEKKTLTGICKKNPYVKSSSFFYESQSLLAGEKNRTSAAMVRAVENDLLQKDSGFAKELSIVHGKFELEKADSIILGTTLARNLGVGVGSTVNLMALAGGKDVELLSQNRKFTVTGIFKCSYEEINSGYCFIGLQDGIKYFGREAGLVCGIKLNDYEKDIPAMASLHESMPDAKIVSWREFNRAFFGALKIEKNILILLVCIIFLVVGINIYNGMRRLVFERRQEIAVMSAIGGTKNKIKLIFVMQGLSCGLLGTVFGLASGLLISYNIKPIFELAGMITGNPDFALFARIPAIIQVNEVTMITLFGIFSPVTATWLAGKNILDLKISEVLHDE